MKARDVMTRDPACCTPTDSARDAARLMTEHDCGCIPVVEDRNSKRLIGTVTDRDLACRGVAEGKGPETPIGELMSPEPSCCMVDDDISAVERVMEERQVRRVPILDQAGACVGIIAQADLARALSDRELGDVVEKISEPSARPRTGDGRPEVR